MTILIQFVTQPTQLTVMLGLGESGHLATCRLELVDWANRIGQGENNVPHKVRTSNAFYIKGGDFRGAQRWRKMCHVAHHRTCSDVELRSGVHHPG